MSSIALGQKIRKYRLRSGKSQFQLELEMGIYAGSISRSENNLVNSTKETLLKLINILNISTLKSSTLFDLDIKSEFERYTKIAQKLNSQNILTKTLNFITADLIHYIDGNYAVIFMLNQESSELKVRCLNVHPSITILCSTFIGYPLDIVKFNLKNESHLKNFCVRSFIEDNMIETKDVYDASYPLLIRELLSIAQKLANINLIIALPLKYNNKSIGVLGVVINRSEISDVDKSVSMNLINLISSTIYRFIN